MKFEISAIIPLAILFLVNSISGDGRFFRNLQAAEWNRLPTDRELKRRYHRIWNRKYYQRFFRLSSDGNIQSECRHCRYDESDFKKGVCDIGGNPSCSRSDSEVFGFIKDDSAMRAWRRGRFGVCFYRNDGNPTACNGKTDCP